MGLTVDANISHEEDLFGKDIDDLQANVTVGSEGISGTLKYVDDYSSAYLPGEDSGHYLVLHAEVPETEGVVLTAEVLGGDHGPVTLDETGVVILRIKDNTQRVKFTASKTGLKTVAKVYRLNGLNLA